jgi:hypothetical protein
MPDSKLAAGARLQYGPLAKLSAGVKAGYDLARVGVGLSRGPNQTSKTVAAAWSNTWPAPGATLDLDFANNRGFVRGVGQGGVMDAITFTRASIGKYVDISGIVQDAPINAPRFDWASTASTGAGTIANPYVIPLQANSTCNGLLIEEARTNRLLWCRDTTNAAWTKVGVMAAKDQTGIDGVANAASSLTAILPLATCTQTITLASGSRTGSFYLKRITGTGAVQVSLDGSTWSTVDLSNGLWNRIVLSGTVTNPTVGILIATNGDAVAMDYGQIEDGAFATTPILTTTASATRSADLATSQGANFDSWINLQQGTAKCDFAYLMPLGLSDQRAVFSIDTNNNGQDAAYMRLFKSSFSSSIAVLANGNQTGAVLSVTQNAPSSMAISATRTAAFGASNGGTIFQATSATSAINLPFTRLYLGGYAQNLSSCVTIKRFVFFPKALPGALQNITGGRT